MNEFLILPECDDTNRGDQALIWETIDLASEAGFTGKYYMLAADKASVQSEKKGIGHMQPILMHPSHHFEHNDNLKYTTLLKIKWGIVALKDLCIAFPLLFHVTRKVMIPLLEKEAKSTLDHYAKASASFVKGGGFLHAYGGLTETYKIFYFLYHINLALSYGHEVYIMPNSFGPFNAPLVKHMIRKTLSRCKVIFTRESISKSVIQQQLKLDVDNEPDLAFYLPKEKNEIIKKSLISKGVPVGKKKCVAITVRPYRFPGEVEGEKIFDKYIAGVGTFVKWLYEHDYFPVFVEHVSSQLPHEDDMKAIEQVAKLLPQNDKWCIFSDTNLTCKEMKSVYSHFDYTVGTRFHSVIFSLSEGVPSIAITYGGNKGLGIMKDIGLEQYAVDMKVTSGEILIERFSELVSNRECIVQKLQEVKYDMMGKREEMIQKLRK